MAGDVLVIGAGVFGLWAARACLKAGLSVTLADAGGIGAGAGASGGLVGALCPHMPGGPPSALKTAHLAALRALPDEIAALETGTTGYRRAGRIVALADGAALARAGRQAAAAEAEWGVTGLLTVEDPDWPEACHLAPESRPAGVLVDRLSAQLWPRGYLAALAASLEGRAELRPGWRFEGLGPDGSARFAEGRISAGAIVIAMGSASFAAIGHPGGGVKGQSALLDATLPANCPLLTAPGLYVAAHVPGRVAIGSTFEPEAEDPAPDSALDKVIAKAAARLPALGRAPVIERWAGFRPHAGRPQPLVGPLPGRPGLWIASGGHRIGFALAHVAGRALAAEIAGTAPPAIPLPEDWRPGAP